MSDSIALSIVIGAMSGVLTAAFQNYLIKLQLKNCRLARRQALM